MSSSVGRNSLVMASGTAASRLTGQLRTILLAASIGTTGLAANAYQAGAMIPQVIFTLVSGGIFNAVLVPQIVRTLKDENAEERLNKLITFALTLLLGVTIAMSIGSPLLTRLYTNGAGSDMIALTNAFTLWCMPQILFYGLYTVVGQILAAKNRFGMYAWSSVGANIISCIGFIAFIVLFGKSDQQSLSFWTGSKLALTAGAWTLGVAFQALVLFIPLRNVGFRVRLVWGIRGIGLRSMGPVAAWSVGIVGIDQLAGIINTQVTTSAPTLAMAHLKLSEFEVAGNATYQNAYTLYILPYSLIAVSVATAIFPKISRAIADHDIATARFDLSESLRNVGMLMFFFTVAFIVMPVPITLALLPSVSLHEATLISGPLTMLAVSLPLASAYLIIQRTFYAFEDGKRPFLFIALQAGLQVAVLLIGKHFLSPVYWVDLLGASITIAFLLSFPLLVWMLRSRFEGQLDGRRLLRSYGKSGIAAAAALIGGLWMREPAYSLVGHMHAPEGMVMRWLQALVVCFVLTVTITVIYVGMLWLLRTEELTVLIGHISHRRLSAIVGSAPRHTRGATGYGALHSDDMTSLDAAYSHANAIDPMPPANPSVVRQSSTRRDARQAEDPLTGRADTRSFGPSTSRTTTQAPSQASLSAIPMDRITGTSHAHAMHRRVEGTMKPELGTIVINRYTLMSLLREEAGLQAWRANDRVLSHDCQLFLINNPESMSQIGDVASALVLSRNSHVTEVLQLQRHDNTMVVVTELDRGTSLSAYLRSRHGKPVDREMVRSILAQASRALQQLLSKGLHQPALSTDTIRLTTHGIELADIPISPLLTDVSGAPRTMPVEQRAIYQLASVLYAMLTNTPSQQLSGYDMSRLPADTADEFRLLCRRGLNLQEPAHTTVPMVTLAEFIALLGEWTPFDRLAYQTLSFAANSPDKPSIVPVRLNEQRQHTPFDLDGSILLTEAQLAAQSAASEPDNRDSTTLQASVPSGSIPASGVDLSKGSGSSLWDKAAPKPVTPEEPAKPEPGFRDIAAAEMAGIISPTVPGIEDDLPFPEFPTSGTINVSGIPDDTAALTTHFDFASTKSMAPAHPDLSAQPDAVEATGRIPIIDSNGNPVRPGEESLRALKAEQAQRDAALPPSFSPQNHDESGTQTDTGNNGDIANARLFGGIRTKVIAITAVGVILIAALGLAMRSLTQHGGSGLGQSGTSQWSTANLDNVPFGNQTHSNDSSSSSQSQDSSSSQSSSAKSSASSNSNSSSSKQPIITADKQVNKVPNPKIPTNTTPFDVDKQEFITNPGGQRGYGYYMHLSQAQDVYRFVVKIRSSGGKAYLRANTTADPNQGEQVAEFSFDASGTTDIKLSKQIKAQDFVLWVPIDSLPNNQLYVNSVQFF